MIMKELNEYFEIYKKIPVATVCNHKGTIYELGWYDQIGLACMSPHPHIHLTFDKFKDQMGMASHEFLEFIKEFNY